MKFWADENFNGNILNALRTRYPEYEIERVQDTAFYGAEDQVLLEQASEFGIVIITHDVQTMTKYAYERINAGLPMSGVIEVSQDVPARIVIEALSVLIGSGISEDFDNQVLYITGG